MDKTKEADTIEARAGRRWALPLLAAAVGLLAAGVVWHAVRNLAQPPPPLLVQAPAAGPARLAGEAPLPPAAQLDALVRRLAGALSAHPGLGAWLGMDDLAGRFVAAVDNAAEGRSPRAHLPALAPDGWFEASPRGERWFAGASVFKRYDLATGVVASLDAAGAAAAYRELEPLLDRAYHRLGYPGRPFRPVLRRALERVAQAPALTAPVELVPRGALYAFADPRLEEADDFTKLVLRTGPRNAERLRAKAKELLAALDPLASAAPRP